MKTYPNIESFSVP